MSLKDKILLDRVPEHIAIIMDGNGRWAKEHGKNRLFGHKNGVESVKHVAEACAQLGVKYLTLYAFSTENWNRPVFEVTGLMDLLFLTVNKEINTLIKNNIRLKTIGNLSKLPTKTQKAVEKAKQTTKDNAQMDLIMALNYSGREELLNAIKTICEDVKNNKIDHNTLTTEQVDDYLYTKNVPDPELLIRTSGEYRMSNFLLWQAAYTEFYFTDEFWPEFGKESLYKAIVDFQSRERRFGKTSEQVKL